METINHNEPDIVAESEIIIAGIRFRVKSVFTDKIKLEDAIKNIAIKKHRNNSQPKAG